MKRLHGIAACRVVLAMAAGQPFVVHAIARGSPVLGDFAVIRASADA